MIEKKRRTAPRRGKKRLRKYVACSARSKENRKLIGAHDANFVNLTLKHFPKVRRKDLFGPGRNLEAAAARSVVFAALYLTLDGQGGPDIARYFGFSAVTVWNGIQRAREAARSKTVDWYGRRLRKFAADADMPIEWFAQDSSAARTRG